MPSRNQLTYSPETDFTYIVGPDGKQIGGMEGDQRNNPLAYDPGVAGSQQVLAPFTSSSGPSKIAQMGRDFAVNSISQVPLSFIPGEGPVAGLGKMALSLALGTGMDQMVNPQRPVNESIGEAGLNTAIGSILPELLSRAGGKSTFKIPGMRSTTESVTTRDPTLRESSNESSGTRSGTSSTEGTRSGVTDRTTVGQQVQDAPVKTPAMVDIENELARLKGMDTSKYNAGAIKQVNNAIEKHQLALDALTEANTGDSKWVTQSHGTSSGTSASQTKAEGASASQSSGESTTTPGTSRTTTTTESTGHDWWGRLGHLIADMTPEHVRELTKLQNFGAGVGGNTGLDLFRIFTGKTKAKAPGDSTK